MEFRIAVCMQRAKIQVLCSMLMIILGSFRTPTSTAWMCGGNYIEFGLYSNQLDDLCCKYDPLGLMCLHFYLLLLAGAPSLSVLGFHQFGLHRSVGIYCMGSGILLLLLQRFSRRRVAANQGLVGWSRADGSTVWLLHQPRETWLVVKEKHYETANATFAGSGIQLTGLGRQYLGSAIGSAAFSEAFVKMKVEGWVYEIEQLSLIANSPSCSICVRPTPMV